MKKKQQRMTRDEAAALYDSLRKTMESKYGKKELSKLIAEEKQRGGAKKPAPAAPPQRGPAMARPQQAAAGMSAGASGNRGTRSAILFVVLVACVKLSLSVL